MSPRSEFQRSLDPGGCAAEANRSTAGADRRLADSGNIPDAFNMAFTFAAEAEKLTLLARSIPAYTGHPQAALLSEELMVETVPVDMAIPSRVGSCSDYRHCCQRRSPAPPAIFVTCSTQPCAVSLPVSFRISIPTVC